MRFIFAYCFALTHYVTGLREKYSIFLNNLPYVHGVLTLNTTKSYFPNDACRFKPLMFLEFIEMYQKKHECRFFFYGDAVSILNQFNVQRLFYAGVDMLCLLF